MILVIAVLAGLLAGLLRAWFTHRSLRVPDLRILWLVPLAFIPQLIAFYLPISRRLLPEWLAAGALVISMAALLSFAIANLDQPGFWMMTLGLGLNFLVILANGGLMPISPQMVTRLIPEAPAQSWSIGTRLGFGKDIVLPIGDTTLWLLSDRFLLPAAAPFRVAFSLGDLLIAAGIIWFLWNLPGQTNAATRFTNKEIINHVPDETSQIPQKLQ